MNKNTQPNPATVKERRNAALDRLFVDGKGEKPVRKRTHSGPTIYDTNVDELRAKREIEPQSGKDIKKIGLVAATAAGIALAAGSVVAANNAPEPTREQRDAAFIASGWTEDQLEAARFAADEGRLQAPEDRSDIQP